MPDSIQQAAYIHAARDVRLGPFRPEATERNDVAVAVAASGICGSDLHYYKDGGIGSAGIREPFVPGHEFAATLLDDVPSRKLTRGTLVAVDPATPCRACEWCDRGHPNLCPNVVFIGSPPHHGAMTTRLFVPAASLVPLPDGMDAETGAMLEPLGVCIHAGDLAQPRAHETAAVLGCGPIGLGLLQVLRDAGVSDIVCIDPQAHRARVATSLGASATGDSIEAVLDHSDGRGVDLVVEATNSPNGFADSVSAAAIGARMVLVGIPDGDRYELAASEARRRGLTVRFSRRMGHVYPRAIELVQRGRVDLGPLVSHRVALEDVPDAFHMQADEADGLVKTVVFPNG